MPALLIDDGLTLSATLEPVPGAVLAVRYRPALYPAVAERDRLALTAAGVDATADLIAAHVVSWDAEVRDAAGGPTRPLPVTREGVKKLPWQYVDALLGKITTWSPADLGKA